MRRGIPEPRERAVVFFLSFAAHNAFSVIVDIVDKVAVVVAAFEREVNMEERI